MARHASGEPPKKAVKIPSPPPDPRLGQNPYQVLAQVAMVLSSVSILGFGPAPTSAISDVPPGLLTALAVTTIIGGVICLVGVWLKDMMWAAWTEAAGQMGILGPLALYVIDVIANVHGWPSALGAGLQLCVLGAAGIRIIQLARWVHWVVTQPTIPNIPTIPLPVQEIEDAIAGLAEHYGDAHRMGHDE